MRYQKFNAEIAPGIYEVPAPCNRAVPPGVAPTGQLRRNVTAGYDKLPDLRAAGALTCREESGASTPTLERNPSQHR